MHPVNRAKLASLDTIRANDSYINQDIMNRAAKRRRASRMARYNHIDNYLDALKY